MINQYKSSKFWGTTWKPHESSMVFNVTLLFCLVTGRRLPRTLHPRAIGAQRDDRGQRSGGLREGHLCAQGAGEATGEATGIR